MRPLPTIDLEHILQHTRHLWERARGRRIFLSGGTGFFGVWLLESLVYCNRILNLDLQATVLSRSPVAFAKKVPHLAIEPCLHVLQGDVRTFQLPREQFPYVIHAAATTSTEAARQPLELLATHFEGTRRMLEFARERGTSNFLFISSGAVYGRQPQHLSHISEDYQGGPDWLDPNAAYAEGKRISEQMCSVFSRESSLDVRIARCFAFVGPHLPLAGHFAIGNFIGDALAQRSLFIRGDGTPLRSYLYAADLAIWLWTMLFSKIDSPSRLNVFNTGSAGAISIHDLAREVLHALNPSLKLEIACAPVPGAPVQRYVPDVSKAESMLNLKQIIGLREAIRRTADWYSLCNDVRVAS